MKRIKQNQDTAPLVAADVPKHDRDSGFRPRKKLRSIADLDGRSRAAIQARTLVGRLSADLGGNLTSVEQELVKRCALLGAMIEDFEVRWLQSEPANLSLYGQLVDRQRRIFATLGLKRTARDITPPKPDYDWRSAVKRIKAKAK